MEKEVCGGRLMECGCLCWLWCVEEWVVVCAGFFWVLLWIFGQREGWCLEVFGWSVEEEAGRGGWCVGEEGVLAVLERREEGVERKCWVFF